jgi:hypothetical protein
MSEERTETIRRAEGAGGAELPGFGFCAAGKKIQVTKAAAKDLLAGYGWESAGAAKEKKADAKAAAKGGGRT